MAEHEFGRRYSIRTIIAPLAEQTVVIDAGAVTIGVESRIIDEATVHDSLVAAREDDGVVRTAPVDDDGGVSLHVFDAATGAEYLRFDLFERHPHYHYINPGEYQVNIPYDRHASGDMYDWVIACLRHRLADMLAYCEAPELAARIDPMAIDRALPEVARAVHAATDGATDGARRAARGGRRRPMTTEADAGHQLDTLIDASISELDTPAVLLDLDRFERNAESIHRVLAEHGMTWRPHSKAHKSPRLAQLQLAHGAIGVTCAKLAEAEVMVAGGISDVLVANQLGSPAKWRRASALQRHAAVTVCVDDAQHVRWASTAAAQTGVTIPLLIEVDVGMHRTGVTSPEAALALAALITVHQGVRLAGIMGYEGHLLRVWPQEEKTRQLVAAMSILSGTADRLRDYGYSVDIVSSGGTGSFETTAGLPGLTESQAGGGCLMDRFYAEDCHVDLEHALTVQTTVVSRQAEGRAIVDAGFKALGGLAGFQPPWVIDPPALQTVSLSAEHGILADAAGTAQVGDRVQLVPAYSDAMLFLHDHVIGHRDGRVTEIVAMPGRGRLV